MSNIFNHNRLVFEYCLNHSDYWDFQLARSEQYSEIEDGLTTRCLVSFIDTTDKESVIDNRVYSSSDYSWSDCRNKGITLQNIGYTGVDNGIITYNKTAITKDEFMELYTKSELSIEEGDCRFFVTKIDGNNQIYSYPLEFVEEDEMNVAKMNGGFLQGFTKLNDGCDYQVLPTEVGPGFTFEFVLKKQDFQKEDDFRILNDVYPENKGIFFYIGTRAENKWWKYYKVDQEFDDSPIEFTLKPKVTDPYLAEEDDGNDTFFISDDYFSFDSNEPVDTTPYSIDDYIKEPTEDDIIDEDEPLYTYNGNKIQQANIIEIGPSDNKFLMFNRTKEGYTIHDWEEDTEITLTDIEIPEEENYFLLFNRTKTGYTIHTFETYQSEASQKYNVLKDLYRNALAFRINDNGAIGYKYMVRDCDADPENYKILEEWSNDYCVEDENWTLITIKIVPNVDRTSVQTGYQSTITDTMRLMVYVQGKLVLVSKDLPLLDLRALNETLDKQESVPYNISLGGGTQGLCDTVYTNFLVPPEKSLPLEQNFAGTFIGYFKSFKFYDCLLNYQEIQNNYDVEIGVDYMDPNLYRRIYYGTLSFDTLSSETPLTDDDILSLNTLDYDTRKFNMQIPLGARRMVVAYPIEIGEIESIVDTNDMQSRIEDSFKYEERVINIKKYNRKVKYRVYHLDYAFKNNKVDIYKVNI